MRAKSKGSWVIYWLDKGKWRYRSCKDVKDYLKRLDLFCYGTGYVVINAVDTADAHYTYCAPASKKDYSKAARLEP